MARSHERVGEALVLPLTATMILWINLVTDSGPALAVGIDPPGQRLMQRPPHDPTLGVITRHVARHRYCCCGCGGRDAGRVDTALPGGKFAATVESSMPHTRLHTLVLFSLFTVFAARSDEAGVMRDLFTILAMARDCSLVGAAVRRTLSAVVAARP